MYQGCFEGSSPGTLSTLATYLHLKYKKNPLCKSINFHKELQNDRGPHLQVSQVEYHWSKSWGISCDKTIFLEVRKINSKLQPGCTLYVIIKPNMCKTNNKTQTEDVGAALNNVNGLLKVTLDCFQCQFVGVRGLDYHHMMI